MALHTQRPELSVHIDVKPCSQCGGHTPLPTFLRHGVAEDLSFLDASSKYLPIGKLGRVLGLLSASSRNRGPRPWWGDSLRRDTHSGVS